MTIWQSLAEIAQRPGGWVLPLFAVFLYLFAVYFAVGRISKGSGRRSVRTPPPDWRLTPNEIREKEHREALRAIASTEYRR